MQFLYFIFVPFFIAGMIKSANRDYHMLVYLFLTVVLYIFYPEIGSLRFLFPLFPFFMHFTLIGVNLSYQFFQQKYRHSTVSSLIIFLIIFVFPIMSFVKSSLYQAYVNIQKHRIIESGPFSKTSQEMSSFISNHIRKDAVIGFFDPNVLKLLTNHQSIRINNLSNLTTVDYLCVFSVNDSDANLPKTIMAERFYIGKYAEKHQIPQIFINELLKEKQLNLVYENKQFRIFEIIRPFSHHI